MSSASFQPAPWSSRAADLPQDRVLASYHDGVKAFAHLAAKTTDWAVPTPCAGWTLLELSGHALNIARYFHRLLNAAAAGTPACDLPTGPALAEFNAAELLALGPLSGSERVTAFHAIADRYGERLAEADWSATLGYWQGRGHLTVGEHTLLATNEWHIHAWDVAKSFGWDYRPDDPDVPYAGLALRGPASPAGTAPSTAEGPVAVNRPGVFASGSGLAAHPVAFPGGTDPWRELLLDAGRRLDR